MNSHFSIIADTIHIWYTHLSDFKSASFEDLLTQDEIQRANRFRFELHRERYIIGRGILRKLLNQYTGKSADQIEIAYGPHGKPYLANNPLDIHFNLSHSDDLALYAFTIHKEMGIDIQKMEDDFKESIAKRFFSAEEYNELMQLSDQERVIGFYRLWASKEAFIKNIGKGLFAPHDQFSIHPKQMVQQIQFENQPYVIQFLDIDPNYQSAFVVKAPVTGVIQRLWSANV